MSSVYEFLLFLDLSGYTALTDVHGGQEAAKVVHRLMQIVDEVLTDDIVFEERVGDEIILSAKKGEQLLQTALKLKSILSEEANYPSFHAALHYGEIFRQEGGIFGTTINLTSRIVSHAKSTQILCSKAFLLNIEKPEYINYEKQGKLKFKNLMSLVEVFEITTPHYVSRNKKIDPVCKMTLFINEKTRKIELANKMHYFCSNRCLGYFERHPDRFIAIDNQ